MNALQNQATANSAECLRELLTQVLFPQHQHLHKGLAWLNEVAERVARARVIPGHLMDRFQRELHALTGLLETQLAQQECRLFPMLRQLSTSATEICVQEQVCNELCAALVQASRGNRDVLARLNRLHELLCDPEWTDQGVLVEELLDAVCHLTEELTTYVQRKAQHVFPAVRGLCAQVIYPSSPGVDGPCAGVLHALETRRQQGQTEAFSLGNQASQGRTDG